MVLYPFLHNIKNYHPVQVSLHGVVIEALRREAAQGVPVKMLPIFFSLSMLLKAGMSLLSSSLS